MNSTKARGSLPTLFRFSLYSKFSMRGTILAVFALLAGSAVAAEIPRPSPDFVVQMAGGKQVKVSDYRGKVLCFILMLTTCPHCQKTTQILTGIEKDLGPKGFAVLEAAINDNPDVPRFVAQFKPDFPVGTAGALAALDYIQWPRDKRPLVPFLVFIDRKGIIRAQYTGVDEDFMNEQTQDQHIRAEVEKLLAEGAAPAKGKSTKKSQ